MYKYEGVSGCVEKSMFHCTRSKIHCSTLVHPAMSEFPETYHSERTGGQCLGRNGAGLLALVLTARAMVGGGATYYLRVPWT